MLKPSAVKPLGNSREVAQLLRPVPTLKQIPGVLKEEARDQFLHGPKNSMNYYFIPPEKNSPEKKTGNPVEKSFKSIHGNVETREKQRIIEKLSDPKYNFIEKQALKEVRRKQGKLFLLNDIYHEMTKEVTEKSKTDVRPAKKKKIHFHLEEEEKMVEELERWEKLTVQKKPKVTRDTENPNDMSDIKHDNRHFVLPQIKRPAAIETNGSGVVLEKFIRRHGSQRSSIAIPISLDGENMNGVELPSPIHAAAETMTMSMVNYEEHGRDDHDHGLIKIVGVMQQDEDLDIVRAQIYKMMEGEDDLDFSGENIRQFSLKNIAILCRGINQDMEEKVDVSLNETNSMAKECEDLLKKLDDEHNKLSQDLVQLNKQIEKLGYHKRNQDDYAFLESEDRQLWDEDREMDTQLKNEVDEINYRILENHAAALKAEKEFREYKGKLVNIQTLQKQLYKAILFQGLDTKDEGLVWIVRKLLEIGDTANQKDFPRYLDPKSRKYIIDRLKAQNEIKELNHKERSVIDNFRKSKEQVDITTQLSSALLNNSKNTFENSKIMHSLQGDFRSSIKSGSVRSSAELPRTSVKSAFRIDTLDTSQSPESRKTLNNDTLGRDSSREGLNNSKSKDMGSEVSPATLPTEGNDEDMQESWHGGRSESRKWSKLTENEEIYNKAKKVMRDIMKKEETRVRPQPRSRTYAPMSSASHKSILKTSGESIFANTNDNRRDFLLKMQSFHQDLQSKQEKMKEEYEIEVTRIITEYGNPRKNVDLGIYLTAVIGPSETIKYFNKFGIREQRPI